MAKTESELIVGLRSGSLSKDEFTNSFPFDLNCDYLSHALGDSLVEQDGDWLEDVLYVGFTFNLFRDDQNQILCTLLREFWHRSHEDIVIVLQEQKSPSSVDAIYHAATSRFGYLAYNDSSSLAIKCIWALAKVNTDLARQKLRALASSDIREEVRQTAKSRL